MAVHRDQDKLLEEKGILRKQEKELAEKRKKKAEERAKLVEEINRVGVWKTKEEVEQGLSVCGSESCRVSALKLQLKFRKTVLCQEAPSSAFAFSKNGSKYSAEQLGFNLLSLLP